MKKTISLEEKEITSISSFVKDVINIPMVECVYLMPYYSMERDQATLDVVAIWNNNPTYNELLTGEKSRRDITFEASALDMTIGKYMEDIDEDIDRLSFSKENIDDYSLTMLHRREYYAEKSLASGIILFDRFEQMAINQEKAYNYLGKFENAADVINIDEVLGQNRRSSSK